jgi:hypothetical protein
MANDLVYWKKKHVPVQGDADSKACSLRERHQIEFGSLRGGVQTK